LPETFIRPGKALPIRQPIMGVPDLIRDKTKSMPQGIPPAAGESGMSADG
jgi:hypothetical protein